MTHNNIGPPLYLDDPLWKRISAFHPDDPGAMHPFSRKLAKEQGWSPGFTQKAITEYKRFVYLCCTLPGGASPSETIDEVWHLHLTYTINYWNEFCAKVLGRPLHHHPSTGGRAEHGRHEEWRNNTLSQYHAVFGETPPAAIWGGATAPPRRHFRLFRWPLAALGLLLLAGCDGGFSAFAMFLIGGVFILSLLTHGSTGTPPKNGKGTDGSGCSGGGSGCSGGGDGGGGGCGGGCGGCGGCGGG